jgi:DNA repair protein RadC
MTIALSPASIRELPAHERPRERLRRHGAQALSIIELTAIILGAGAEGRSALDVSRDLLSASQGSLKRLAARPVAALTAVHGIGHTRAVTIHAALELGRRMMAETVDEGIAIISAADVYAMYASRIENLPYEEFHVGILNGKHRLETDVLITRGLLNSSLVHPREVFRQAIAENACAAILIHNHPSGDPSPSSDDVAITAQLVTAGRLIGIEIIDHVIIGRGRFMSFAEDGLLL